ncbi:porin family protein [Rubrivirga sp. S365]|uniref:Porin family protein n=1 Tax=Rubrivirga litoralis TaxID=3075598 RepID=A0ABU3BM05_9BACT|nr:MULTISPECIES: porin family protein [unclassified Rubrivirga]MDT0630329.1 porin family protein [Rubrivirga sp. F394]MDT7855841.1 porin family protein [Rubrivirga sp. S365]
MRYALLSLLALGLALPTAAQTTYGVRAGLNVSDVVGFDDNDIAVGIDKTPSLGFVGGVFAEVPVSPRFSIRPEVLYSRKGVSFDPSDDFVDDIVDFDSGISLGYIEVPVLARVGVPLGQFLDAGLLVGPTFAFKVSESFDANGSVGGVDFDLDDLITEDGEDAFETFDFGLAVGAEVGSGPFYVDLRYTPSLLNANRNDSDLAPTLRNSVFSVTGTFKFGR